MSIECLVNISLYSFIIFTEYLGNCIHFMTNVPKFGIGSKVIKNGHIIPYLMFFDDFMIFAKQTGRRLVRLF